MASAEHIKALLKSHANGDDAHFYAVAMQVAASEARRGHTRVAEELRALIDEAKKKDHQREARRPVSIAQPRGELAELLDADFPKTRLRDMTLEPNIKSRLQRVVQEQRMLDRLRQHGLFPRRRLLMIGPPGCGKTMSAAALAGELSLPLFTIRLDGLLAKYMGETVAKLRLIFNAMQQSRGVYLFDEFDSIGFDRSFDNDVGEIRRVLNGFLQHIERDPSNSILIAATNHAERLDPALFRRFDDVIQFDLPTPDLVEKALRNRFALVDDAKEIDYHRVAEAASRLSFADVLRASDEALKDVVLNHQAKLTTEGIISHLRDRTSHSSCG